MPKHQFMVSPTRTWDNVSNSRNTKKFDPHDHPMYNRHSLSHALWNNELWQSFSRGLFDLRIEFS